MPDGFEHLNARDAGGVPDKSAALSQLNARGGGSEYAEEVKKQNDGDRHSEKPQHKSFHEPLTG